MSLTSLPVLGSFGKAVDGAVSLNFAPSAGHNCDPSCPLLNKLCYAKRTELRPDRSELATKLARHAAAGATAVTARALEEIQRRSYVPWLRISTNGSVPNRPDRDTAQLMRELLEHARERSIP